MERNVPIQGFTTFDSRQFRTAMGRFASGVTVITTEVHGQIHGMTANAFMSVSLGPPLVAVSIDNRAHMKELLIAGRNFGVSILGEEQEALSKHFAGRPVEGLDIRFVSPTGTPLMEGALAHLVVRIVDVHSGGDHTLYMGEVEYVAWRDSRPLLFYGGKYHHLMPEQTTKETWAEDEMSLFSFSMGRFDQTTSKEAGGDKD